MKFRLKRILASLLFAGMIVSSMPMNMVYAEESGTVEETGEEQETADSADEAAESQTDPENAETSNAPEVSTDMEASDNNEVDTNVEEKSDVSTEADAASDKQINFVYIESSYLETPGTQRIVFDFGETIQDAQRVTLTVTDDLGYKTEWETSRQAEGLYLFEKDFTGEAYTGSYEAVSVNIYSETGTEVLDLDEMDIEAEFGVNEEYSGYEELQPINEEAASDEQVETSVVTIDENGVTKAQDSIADALNEVSAETEGISTFSAASSRAASSRSGNIVVALDPGHDSRSTGASANGLREEVLTLKIANYCKEELEKYAGVEIYMTRTGADCPYNMSGAGCIEYRVRDAAAAGAQIYVSFHLNSSTSSSPKGAEVIVPNRNWRPELGEEGEKLASAILDELVKVGLTKRPTPIYSRDSESGNTYADGSAADYFSVQRNCKLNNIPGIIIEHAFLTNSGDVNNFLNSEAGLKKLGVADATGIAKYLGLAKVGERIEVEEGTYTIESALASDKVIEVSGAGWDAGTGIVLSDEDNAKSSQRYEIVKTSDGYYNIIAEHSGKALEVQGNSSGASICQKERNVNSQAQKWYFVNAGNGRYNIASAYGTYMDVQSGLTSSGTPVWTYDYNGTNAQIWQLEKSEYQPVADGTYVIENAQDTNMVLNVDGSSLSDYANVSLHQNEEGSNQRFEVTYVGGGYYKIFAEHSGKSLDVASGLTAPGTNLQQCVWNETNAQLWKFVDAGNGSFYIRSKLGTVIDLASGQAVSGTNACMDNMNGDACQKWKMEKSEYRPVEDGQYVISNAGSPYNVMTLNSNNIEVGLYSASDTQMFDISYVDNGYYKITSCSNGNVLDVQNGSAGNCAVLWTYQWNASDAQLWKFVPNSDGSYQIRSKLGTVIDIASGVIVPGTYIQMYTPNGSIAQKWKLESDKGEVNFRPVEDGTYTIESMTSSEQVLDVSASSENDGANIQTYTSNNTSAQRFEIRYQGDGYYQILAEHSGKSLDVSGAVKSAGANVWQYTWNGSDAQLWRIMDAGDGTYFVMSKLGTVLDINGNIAREGTNVQTSYLSAKDSQKWKFVESDYKPVADGLYSLRNALHTEYTVDIASASMADGGNVWLYNYNGTPAQRFNVVYVDGGYYKIEADHSGKVLDVSGASASPGANVWQYAWNGSDAQLWKFVETNNGYYIKSKLGTVLDISAGVYAAATNIQTYTANGSSAQKWELEKEYASAELEEGTYIIHSKLNSDRVLDIANGSTENCGNLQIFAPNNSSAQKFTIEAVSDGYYKITSEISGKVLDVANGSSNAGTNVWQYEWNGSSAQQWRFMDIGNGVYYIQSRLGTVLDVNGASTALGSNVQTYTVNNTNAQKWTLEPVERQLYSIMGDSAVTAEQMAEFFNDRCTVDNQYPYSDVTEAPTIEDFCKIYIEECEAEGVKAEVAFCQAMLETGFLKFGGDVKKEQYNFAGIGATGGGVPGHSFNTIREGIRAQVQHLKAYASKEPLNQAVVDPRFNFVKRGTAIYVEWLGQKENPEGNGWASSANYGYNIVDYYIVPLLKY